MDRRGSAVTAWPNASCPCAHPPGPSWAGHCPGQQLSPQIFSLPWACWDKESELGAEQRLAPDYPRPLGNQAVAGCPPL